MDYKVGRWLAPHQEGDDGDGKDDSPLPSPRAPSDTPPSDGKPAPSRPNHRPTFDEVEESPHMDLPERLHSDPTTSPLKTRRVSSPYWKPKIGYAGDIGKSVNLALAMIMRNATSRNTFPSPKKSTRLLTHSLMLGAAPKCPTMSSPCVIIHPMISPPTKTPVCLMTWSCQDHTLGLNRGVALTFHDGKNCHGLVHLPRAMVTMGGHARRNCTHCILPGESDEVDGKPFPGPGVRYTLTFRLVPDAHLPPDPSSDD